MRNEFMVIVGTNWYKIEKFMELFVKVHVPIKWQKLNTERVLRQLQDPNNDESKAGLSATCFAIGFQDQQTSLSNQDSSTT